MPNLSDDFKNTDILILCGGEGKRLRPVVSDRPKVMAEVGGRPFLEWTIDRLGAHGFSRVILSVGYLKNYIIDHFRDYGAKISQPIEILFSEEDKPLGTGGAIKKAKDLIESDHFLTLNGDVFLKIPFQDFYDVHRKQNPIASLLVSRMKDVSGYGKIELDPGGRILSFSEKDSTVGEGLVNAGVYLMRRDIFDYMPRAESFSIEYDFFPKVLKHHCHGFVIEEEFLDIGTPDRYSKILQLFSNEKI